VEANGMIYEMSLAIRDDLLTRGFPFAVDYGPIRPTIETYPEGLVTFERDRDASDAVRAPVGTSSNPRKFRTLDMGGRVTIYAASNVAGAHVGEHETLCEDYVDAVIVALVEWATANKAGPDLVITEARHMRANERDDPEEWTGAAYLIRFRVSRAVYKRDGAFVARPTGQASGVANQTQVLGGETPEIGCDST
jgi:hypothetical protein